MTRCKPFTYFYVALAAISLMFLGACGEDSDTDNMPNILTGVTGVIIACLVIWWLLSKRGKGGKGGETKG